ncbi:MAG TPA: dipeptide epimerase [Nitrospira sp.]|nr:dipeptide epimerase [Nitrospira sp.]
MLTIRQIAFWPVDLPLTDPFVVATGSRLAAENVFVRVTLSGGVQGYGEAAPFPEVSGEDRLACIGSLKQLSTAVLGQSADRFEEIGRLMREIAPAQPAARCALECAIIDALCRVRHMPMWALWGAADVRERETDITIPICDINTTIRLARHWHAKGFRLFKMKVGRDVHEDVRRLRAVHDALPDIAFIGDGNQGFSQAECIAFAEAVKGFGGRLVLLEQPVIREDLDGLARIRSETKVPVAADESVRSIADAEKVITRKAADYINIKIMKTGMVEARSIADYTLANGLKLMIGGMVETRLAMGCSFSLALGMKGFEVLDLDTPLLLQEDPVNGGFVYRGPRLIPSQGEGLGMSLLPGPLTTILA